MLERLYRCSGHQVQKALKIAIDAQRQLFDQLRVHGASGIGALGLQNSSVGGHFDGLVNVAGLQFQIDARAVVGLQHYACLHILLETRHFSRDVISPRRQIGERISTACISVPAWTILVLTSVSVSLPRRSSHRSRQ